MKDDRRRRGRLARLQARFSAIGETARLPDSGAFWALQAICGLLASFRHMPRSRLHKRAISRPSPKGDSDHKSDTTGCGLAWFRGY